MILIDLELRITPMETHFALIHLTTLILTVELRMRGMPSALDEFLGDVYGHRPLLKVAELNMVKARDRRTSPRRTSRPIRRCVHLAGLASPCFALLSLPFMALTGFACLLACLLDGLLACLA